MINGSSSVYQPFYYFGVLVFGYVQASKKKCLELAKEVENLKASKKKDKEEMENLKLRLEKVEGRSFLDMFKFWNAKEKQAQ